MSKGKNRFIWRDWELIVAADRKPIIENILTEYPCLTKREACCMASERITNDLCATCERMTLDLPGNILCIADIKTPNGCYHGYRELGGNLADVFKVLSLTPLAGLWIDSRGELRGFGKGKSGHNYYTFRMWRSGVGDRAKDALKQKIVSGAETKADISSRTIRLGDIAGDIFGWSFPGRKPIN